MTKESMIWIAAYAGIWCVYFYLFGMQRTTLLISRRAGVTWSGGGEFLLPKWYPLTWLVIFLKWGVLAGMVVFWKWEYAIGIALAGYVLSIVIPIPYSMYLGFFLKRIYQIEDRDPFLAEQLRKVIDDARWEYPLEKD